MNIKDSYIHNGTAVLKDVKVESSVLKKILAGKDANDAYLGWETVCDLTGIKPKAAGTADKVGHKLTFSGGVTGTWDGSADKTVTIPTKSSWNYDDVYLKLTGNGTTNPLTGTIYIKDANGIILNSKDKDLNIWEVYGSSGVWASQYGFNLQYLGTGSGNNNDLVLWAHNQAGTHVETYRVKQDGTFIFKAAPKVGTNVMYHAGNLTASVIGGLGTLSNNISGNAATATNADKLGNITAGDYFKHRDAVFNSEWSGKYLWTLWDNHLHAADKRLAVTLTGTTSTNFSLLFDGSFESSISITEAKAVLHIKSTTEGNVWTEGLPYGDFYVVFYNSDAENITGRVYCNYAPQGTGWHDLTVTHVGPHIWKLNNGYYQLSDLEITITKPVSSASIDLCQVLHVVKRSPSPYYAAVMSKYCDQKTNYSIEAAKFIKTGGTSSQFLKADGSVDSNTYSKSDHKHSFSDITPGVATIGDGANRLMFRINSSYKNGIYYSTPGNEALVFGTINPMTSWIFATTDPTAQTAWTSLTPSLQIKHGRVTINKLIANSADASYNLDVNGSANATTLYENGMRVSVNGHTHDDRYYTESEVNNLLTNKSNTSHTHSYIVTQGDNRSVATTPNDYKNKIIFAGLKTNTTIGRPSTLTYSYVVGLRGWSDTSGGKAHELAFNDDGIFHRIGATDTWETWVMMLTTANYNSYAPSLTGSGASGTWGINVTGSAGSVTWNNVTGKPSTFTPATHTHTFASLTEKPTTISGYGITDGLRRVTLANNVENDFNTFENLTLTGRGDPTTGSSLLNSPWTTQPAGGFGALTYLWSSYGLQLTVGYNSNDIYIRSKYYHAGGSNWSTKWDKILNSSNYNSYAPKLDGTGATGTWKINISGNAATATNLSKKPSIQVGTSDTKKITITAGGKTSDEYIIPFATASDKLYAYTIAAGTDVNTLKDFKYYVSNSTSVCASIVNGPVKRTNGEMWFLSIPAGASSYGQQLYYSRQATNWQLWTRTWANNSFSPWVQFIHSGNISSQSVSSATTSTYASNVGSSGTAGTNYVTAANVISMYNWYNSITATDDASNTAIDKWNEIVSFLAGITDTSTLSGILAGYAAAGHDHDKTYLKLSGGNVTGKTTIRKDLTGNLSDWVSKQHLGPFEVGRATNSMCVAIGVTDDNYGYIQVKGSNITTPGNLVLLPGGGNLTVGNSTNTVYHKGNLSIATLMGSTAIGDSDEPVYWNGSKFVKAGAYPTKSSWNYDDRYLKLSGGTLTGTLTINTVSDRSLILDEPTGEKYHIISFRANGEEYASLCSNYLNSENNLIFNGNIIYHSGNLPAYPTVNNGALYLQANGTTKITFTANQSNNATLNIATGSSNGTISVCGTNVSVKGLGSNAYSSTAYLPLAGGTMDDNAQIKRKGKSSAWIYGRDNALIRETSSSGYHPLFSLKTKDGSWELGEYNLSGLYNVPIFSYVTDADYSNGNNTTTYQIKYPLASGTIALTADLKWSNISSKPETATRWPSWSEVTNKPSTFPAAGSEYLNNYSITNPNSDAIKDNKVKWFAQINSSSGYAGNNYGFPVSNNANGILYLGTHPGKYGHQLGFSSNGNIYHRYQNGSDFPNTSNGGSWEVLLTSNNYITYTVKKDGTGASGTWEISISGNAKTATNVAWSGVTDKPTFTTWSETSSVASYSLSNAAWTNTITLPTTAGSYILNIVSGNSTLTGVFSIGASDNAKDEISLHLHGNGPRLYARTNGTTLQLSSNDASATSRSVTIKYRRMI